MNSKKIIMITIICAVVIIVLIFFGIGNGREYNVNSEIGAYNLKDEKTKNEYLSYLKKIIKPQKLVNFINDDYIFVDEIASEKTGNEVIKLMKYEAYERMFNDFFDRERKNFDDCPVTVNFIKKFNNNLYDYYKLNDDDNTLVNCTHDDEINEITVIVYSNFENTEPTYQNTHHFHYTLDSDGNVDDVVFDYTDE